MEPTVALERFVSHSLLAKLASGADAADGQPVWPAASWEALREAGVPSWSVTADYGGRGLSTSELLHGYEALAGACLTTAFILSQRESACRRILAGVSEDLRRELLPRLARAEQFATVGLSQLTTSRQHGRPALVAQPQGGSFILNGSMPWVTSAGQADHLVTGATLEDGRQILAIVPRDLRGMTIRPPLDLMALRGSLTAEVRCEELVVERRWLLAGPATHVLATGGKGGTGGVETSCLALGLAGAALDYVAGETITRVEWRATAQRLEGVRIQLRHDLHALAAGEAGGDAAARLRARANALVIRASQVALVVAKGAGFVHPHAAQRWARQALFFLVWSCPRPAAEATLGFLEGSGACE